MEIPPVALDCQITGFLQTGQDFQDMPSVQNAEMEVGNQRPAITLSVHDIHWGEKLFELRHNSNWDETTAEVWAKMSNWCFQAWCVSYPSNAEPVQNICQPIDQKPTLLYSECL